MKRKGSDSAPPGIRPLSEVGQDWPESYYQPDKTLVGRIRSEWITPQYQPRFARHREAYENLETYDSDTLRKRTTEAITIVAKTLHSIERATQEYLSDFKYDGLIHSGFEHTNFFTEKIAFLENTISFCCFVVSSVKIELAKRKESADDISVATGIRLYQEEEEAKRVATELEYGTRDNGSEI